MATTRFMKTVKVIDGKATYIPAEVNERGVGAISYWLDETSSETRTLVKRVPVEYLAFDSRIQIAERAERSKERLIANFDENKMTVLTGVLHPEEGLVSIVDGVGRLTATQIIDPVRFDKLEVQILLRAPRDPEQRAKFEADIFESQDDNKAKLTALQKHGARLLCDDKGAKIMEELRDEYNIVYVDKYNKATANNRIVYNSLYNIVNVAGIESGRYILDIMKESRMMSKMLGKSRYVLRSLYSIYSWYPDKRSETSEFMGKYFRPITPQIFKSCAVATYPMLGTETACSLYLEDIIVEELGYNHTHTVKDGKLIEIAA